MISEKGFSDIRRTKNINKNFEDSIFENPAYSRPKPAKNEGHAGPRNQQYGPGRIRTCDHLVMSQTLHH